MVAAAELRWVWLFLPLTLTHASSGSFSVEVPGTPLSGLLGGSMTLPCTVSNSLDVRQFEVRWYRPLMFHTPVLLYKNGKIEESSAEKQFQGRASLLGGLEKGDVSLKLDKLTLADEGKYICHVSSDNWYDSKNTSLKLQAVGSTPVLSVADIEGGEVNVSCHSTGWLPKPSLTWRDKEGRDLNSFSTDRFTKESEGFTTVSSWLLVSASDSEWISCSLSLSSFNQEMRESRVLPHTPTGVESWKGAFIWTLVLLLLGITGVGVYVVLTRKGLIGSKTKEKDKTHTEAQPLNFSEEKQQQQQHEDPPADTPHQSECTVVFYQMQHVHPPADTPHQSVCTVAEVQQLNSSVEKQQQQQHEHPPADTPHQSVCTEGKLLNSTVADQKQKEPEGTPGEVEDLKKRFKENITIDPEETPEFFRVTGDQKRIHCTHPRHDDDEEQYRIFTLCKEKFSFGKHYWEVKVCSKPKEKASWYVGVASETAENTYRTTFIPKNGFWVLCYEAERGVYIRDLPAPIPLPDVSEELCSVGVFLDCDEHTLSFYNVTTKSHIYTLNNVMAKTSLCPLISPGIRDRHPIILFSY